MNTTLYHVTPLKNVDKIMVEGLIPQVGRLSRELQEQKAVWLFPTEEVMEDALMNWLGESLEEELAVLWVSLPETFPLVRKRHAYEVMAVETIHPDYISYLRKE